VSQDSFIAESVMDDMGIMMESSQHVFLNSCIANKINPSLKADTMHFLFLNNIDRFPEMPLFSDDPTIQLYEGNTVTYACIQLAVYMGYSEIYIIGVDHNYSKVELHGGQVVENDGVKNYMEGLEGTQGFLPALDRTTLAYRKARQVCDEKGIVIRNATRGGKLEEFIRVDFDTLICRS
jgi:hypothetical protein